MQISRISKEERFFGQTVETKIMEQVQSKQGLYTLPGFIWLYVGFSGCLVSWSCWCSHLCNGSIEMANKENSLILRKKKFVFTGHTFSN